MGRGQELLDAAREGDKRTVEKLIAQFTKRSGPFTSLRRGAGVNVQDDNGYTPLHHACLRGHKEIVELLLSVDASPCVLDKKGATPLHLAVFNGKADIVQMLLNHKNPPVNIDQRTTDHQETALIIAARIGFTAIVELLIANGADVTLKNVNGETGLDLAAQYGRLSTVELLLSIRPQLLDQYKYPVSKRKVFASTPLHLASRNGHKNIVLTLLASGVDPNVRSEDGTPLHEAACFGKTSVVDVLLSRGADLYAVDKRGKTIFDLLRTFPEKATSGIKEVIMQYENTTRAYESEEDLQPFPLPDYSPSYSHSVTKAPETQKHNNTNVSLVTPSSSFITKNHPQSFVKKLASKCLGLKSKFSSAPNISNTTGLESVGIKDKKSSTNTLLIGNSKFFKLLSKKEEAGEVVCNDEFDTISLDRLGATLNRDSVVNRSNRSCPGFKTSLPNISENNELLESSTESIVITEIDCDKNSDTDNNLTQAVNYAAVVVDTNTTKVKVNECYESYDFSNEDTHTNSVNNLHVPKPPPRINVDNNKKSQNSIYENVLIENQKVQPKPAIRQHIPPKVPDETEIKVMYENVKVIKEVMTPDHLKITVKPILVQITDLDENSSPSVSRTSTLSSDSMIDETNLEDILLSEKSKSFKHIKKPHLYPSLPKSDIYRTDSNVSNFSDMTEASAIENVDCSDENNDKSIYLSMTGTLPNKKAENTKKKVLFRHKTFTNIEVDRNSTRMRDLPKWNKDILKDTLASYHIRGTGHCIYKAPTVQEFIYIFNRETLYRDVEPFIKVPNDKRDSYFETAICFCKAKPPKFHNSAEDLLEIVSQEEEKVTIDLNDLKNRFELQTSTFRCFCDSEDCKLHDKRRDNNLVVKFSVIKKSISTPNITLDPSPNSTAVKRGILKLKSVPSFEQPYAVVDIDEILLRNRSESEVNSKKNKDGSHSPIYTSMSNQSTTSSSSARPYSIKDIAEVISLSDNSTTDASLECASSLPIRKCSSEHSGHWSLHSCNSNVTVQSEASFKTCLDDSEDDSEGTLHSDDSSDTDTIKSDVSKAKRPWVHSDSFRFGSKEAKSEIGVIVEESLKEDSKVESSGISIEGSESSLSECGDDSGVPRGDVSLASLERGGGARVRSGSGRRRWDEASVSEGDALSVSSAASSCAPLHLAHHHDFNKVSPTPPKKPPRRNLSVSPTHANSPSSGYSYELRSHARSQDDLDDLQGAKHYLKHGRSVDQYVDGKLSHSEYEENHNSPRIPPIPNPRPSLKNRTQPVAITAMYENVVIKEQNPRRKLRRNVNQLENSEQRMERPRKYSNQERSSLESLLDSSYSPSEYERRRLDIPLSPTHYEQPPTPEHPPPSAKQAENSIHERIRPLSQVSSSKPG